MLVLSGSKNILSIKSSAENLKNIIINCDMGEGVGNEEAIMPYIHAANIACGYHAGDITSMQQTVELAIKYNVAIGAHPSFYDRENFGRTAIKCTDQEVYDFVSQQVYILNEVAAGLGATLNHVKPHGALYNMSAKDTALAATIAKAVKDFNASLIVFGLSGSHSISEAKAIGLKTAAEVFADRTYQADGSLTPRSQQGALITTADEVAVQVLQLINEGTVTSMTGEIIPVEADTICIHGDGIQAVEFAKTIGRIIKKDISGNLSGN
jgi:5-oxoprolinase (ATP-hydrolysing) subunit A